MTTTLSPSRALQYAANLSAPSVHPQTGRARVLCPHRPPAAQSAHRIGPRACPSRSPRCTARPARSRPPRPRATPARASSHAASTFGLPMRASLHLQNLCCCSRRLARSPRSALGDAHLHHPLAPRGFVLLHRPRHPRVRDAHPVRRAGMGRDGRKPPERLPIPPDARQIPRDGSRIPQMHARFPHLTPRMDGGCRGCRECRGCRGCRDAGMPGCRDAGPRARVWRPRRSRVVRVMSRSRVHLLYTPDTSYFYFGTPHVAHYDIGGW